MICPGKSVVYCNSNRFGPVSRHFAAFPAPHSNAPILSDQGWSDDQDASAADYSPNSVAALPAGFVMLPDWSVPLPGALPSSSRSSVDSGAPVLRLSHASLLNLPRSAPSNSASSPILCSVPVFSFSLIRLLLFLYSASFTIDALIAHWRADLRALLRD